MDSKLYHESFKDLGKGCSCEALLLEEAQRLTDFDGSKLDLRPHLYQMGDLPPLQVLVKKGVKEGFITATTYNLLRPFRHPNILPAENYYPKGYGWMVVPLVDGTLMGWMRSAHGNTMFRGDGVDRWMAPQFRAMVILLDKLWANRIFPRKFGIENIYIKLENGIPKIKVLLDQVESRPFSLFTAGFGEKIKEIIRHCCRVQGVQLNHLSESFMSFIYQSTDNLRPGKHHHAMLKSFPDIWTTRDKECYLINVVSGGHLAWHAVRSRVNVSEVIDWPRNSDGTVIPAMQNIISLGGKWEKNKDFRFDYIHECRNCYKHFYNLPIKIQGDIGGSPQGLIEKMEEWDPDIWVNLYNIFGPLVST